MGLACVSIHLRLSNPYVLSKHFMTPSTAAGYITMYLSYPTRLNEHMSIKHMKIPNCFPMLHNLLHSVLFRTCRMFSFSSLNAFSLVIFYAEVADLLHQAHNGLKPLLFVKPVPLRVRKIFLHMSCVIFHSLPFYSHARLLCFTTLAS